MTRLSTLAALSLALSAGAASAQDLSAYNALATNLDGAVQARAQSAQAALTRLDAAQTALGTLAPTLRNQQIVRGLNDAVQGARASLARTPAELEAQVLLARGLMRKALYDQTLAALAAAPENSSAQLRVLAREFGVTGQAAQTLTQSAQGGRLERTAWQLQRAAAARVTAALAATRAEQTTTSYVNLARATSWFTTVQDASGVGTLRVSQFGDALRQLTAGDTAALATSLTTLRQGTAALSRSLATPPSATPAPTDPAGTPDPTPDPGTAPDNTVPTQPDPGTSPDPAPTPAPTTPAAGQLAQAYAALGRAQAAAGHGDAAGARDALAAATQALARVPSPLRDTAAFTGVVGAAEAAQGRSALRVSDVQALIAGLAGAERQAAGQASSALDAASLSTSRWFSGWLRVLVFLLLALATAAPLYLLNLAFGGRNTYWRAIMAGLTLLMLPLMLEGVFGLLGALGDAFGAGALRSLTNLTLSQGAYALPLWALLGAAAIGLMTFGFRGLCEQFGLLGAGSSSKNNTVETATTVDWDEEL
ncbi:hypothetical protein GO986_17570 [Deinococcus sp. HMF7620]|uniref:Uncharacterized protein n=1 Tax=Deinococcus arboris TaxID=2682977 RepID=A0A7C9I118_9DEIO|nr:hypothetical protein [Deinococcus arboris]MVN88548.1 hypothetical protein [Deinococcus arboris]